MSSVILDVTADHSSITSGRLVTFVITYASSRAGSISFSPPSGFTASKTSVGVSPALDPDNPGTIKLATTISRTDAHGATTCNLTFALYESTYPYTLEVR